MLNYSEFNEYNTERIQIDGIWIDWRKTGAQCFQRNT